MENVAFEPVQTNLTYENAVELLKKNIQDPVIYGHCRESEVIMRALARHFGQDEEQWAVLGLLHDIDFQETKETPELHCVKSQDILKEAGMSDDAIRIIISHGYGTYCGGDEFKGKERSRPIEHALVASETLTGLIYAGALMRPDKKLAGMTVQSLKKKFKSKGFARNVDRSCIMEIEKIGLTLEEFFEIGIKAMEGIAEEIGV